MMGCRTQALSQRSSQHDSIATHSMSNIRHSAIRDTIAVFDSVHIHEHSDTVYIKHLRTKWRERIIIQTDTLQLTDTVRIELHDTIQTIIPSAPKEQHPEHPLPSGGYFWGIYWLFYC